MVKIRILKSKEGYTKDDVVEVTKNIAHGLIDRGVGKLHKIVQTPKKVFKPEEDKMMTPKKGKGYKVK